MNTVSVTTSRWFICVQIPTKSGPRLAPANKQTQPRSVTQSGLLLCFVTPGQAEGTNQKGRAVRLFGVLAELRPYGRVHRDEDDPEPQGDRQPLRAQAAHTHARARAQVQARAHTSTLKIVQ
jgi:hypothetical protein